MTRRDFALIVIGAIVLAVVYAASRPEPEARFPAVAPTLAEASDGVSSLPPVPTIGMQPASVREPAAAIPPAGNIGTALVSGTASHVGTAFGRRYLALPEHRWGRPGITVRICGDGGCVVRTSTDAGPDLAMQRRGRVADLNAWDFEAVCGCPASRGLTRVTVEYIGELRLPATDTE